MSRFLLRHRLQVMTNGKTPDGGGGYSVGPAVVKTVRGRITAVSGNERVQAMQLEHPVSHEILVRAGHGITAENWLRRGAVDYTIRAILPNEETHRFDRILVESGVAV